jgi:hypothetical protein
MTDPEFVHPMTISWGLTMGTVRAWNEVCALGVELFGLPGDRYITDLTADHMTWIFREPQDALLFRLKFSEHLC